VQFILGIEFRGYEKVFVMLFPLTRKGFRKMCSEIHRAMKCGANSATIADGHVVATFVEMEAWFDLSPLELRSKIARVLSEVTAKKMNLERGTSAAA